MFEGLDTKWKKFLGNEILEKTEKKLGHFLNKEYSKNTILPPREDVFNAFNLCPPKSVKVVILGQDPYPREGIAHGLSFSVKEGVKCPASLRNIYNEICTDLGQKTPMNGDLSRLARQGVLLLNTILTVKKDEPLSHKDKGWEEFTLGILKALSDSDSHVVFIFWGNFANQHSVHIDTSKHLILHAAHPSPLSAYRGFFGCRHFSKANKWLEEKGRGGINW